MNTSSSKRAACAGILAFLTFGFGCKERQPPSVVDAARVDEQVRGLLDRWVRSFESRDTAVVRSVLGSDESFVWLEDGEVRYKGPEEIVAALSSFPPALRFSHELSSVRIVPISDTAAWAHVGTKTEIRQGEQVVSAFAGVVLMLAQREQGQWRIVAAHTSTTRPARGREETSGPR